MVDRNFNCAVNAWSFVSTAGSTAPGGRGVGTGVAAGTGVFGFPANWVW
jgi:hypothetical protein